MGDVETAQPRHEQFSPRRRHLLKDDGRQARSSDDFRRRQTCRPCADNSDWSHRDLGRDGEVILIQCHDGLLTCADHFEHGLRFW